LAAFSSARPASVKCGRRCNWNAKDEEKILETSAVRADPAAKPRRCRSAVTNGSRLHVNRPGDTRWSRRFSDILSEIVSDLGGADCLSEAQRQLARRCATIALECEKIECAAATGSAIDLETYGQLTDRLGRALSRLGIKRQAREVPSIHDYLQRIAEEETANEEPPK
jgi:hypothetical protein